MGPPSWNHGYSEKRAKILESCWSLLPKNAKNPTMKLLGNWGIGEWRWEKEKWSGGFSHSLSIVSYPLKLELEIFWNAFCTLVPTFWLVEGYWVSPVLLEFWSSFPIYLPLFTFQSPEIMSPYIISCFIAVFSGIVSIEYAYSILPGTRTLTYFLIYNLLHVLTILMWI